MTAAHHYYVGDEMGRSKYARQLPETYIVSGQVRHRDGKDGPRSAAEKKALLCPQAETVIRKFGGARELARILAAMGKPINPSSIYRWMHPKEVGGSGGEIPVRHIKLIMKAARMAGILLTTNDLYPHIFEAAADQ